MSSPLNTLLLDNSAWDLVVDSNGDIALAAPPYVVADLTGSTFDGIQFATHVHTGVTSGSGDTGEPV
jgi:hypothetical protein